MIERRRGLVLGGARSGKSAFAEGMFAGRDDVDYLATSQVLDDPEWQQRIDRHRARRPASWATIETLDIPTHLATDSERPLMIDCLTIWLARQMDEHGVWTHEPGCDEGLEASVTELVDAFAASRRQVVAVSNEVGQGLVPADEGSRRFRDEMGVLNARVASVVDDVWFCVAGIPQHLKG